MTGFLICAVLEPSLQSDCFAEMLRQLAVHFLTLAPVQAWLGSESNSTTYTDFG